VWTDDCDLAEAAALSPTVAARWRTIGELLDTYAHREGLDPDELTAFAYVESRFSPSALSNAGARGIMQIMPDTGAAMAKALKLDPFDPWNPAQNIAAGAHFIAALKRRWAGKPIEWARASYFAGPGNVSKYGPGKFHKYTDAIAMDLRAVQATRDRCEHGGGGVVPVWHNRPSPSPRPRPSPSPRPRPSPSPRPRPSPGGGGGIAIALALLVAGGLGRG